MQRRLNVLARCVYRGYSTKSVDADGDPNRLKLFIRDRIRSGGPIPVSEFMSLSVRSAAGYYSQHANKVCLYS